MPAKLSVAMCTYNGGRFVRAQLESIATQTRLPDELVVCDDRSADETVDVVREFAASAPFPVRLFVNERNLGSTKNFEKAVGLCEGDMIALSDQDDVWLPAKLERLEAELAASPGAGLVFSDAEVVDEHARPLGYTLWRSIEFTDDARRAFREGRVNTFDLLLERNFVTGATMAFRAEYKPLVLPVRGIDVSWGEGRRWGLIHDGWIALLIAAVAELIPVPEVLSEYRQHSGQQIGAGMPEPPSPDDDREESRAARHVELFKAEVERLEPIYERLRERGKAFGGREVTEMLRSRVTHMRARAGLPETKIVRLPTVLRELLTLRYHRHSKGLRSAAKDLLF